MICVQKDNGIGKKKDPHHVSDILLYKNEVANANVRMNGVATPMIFTSWIMAKLVVIKSVNSKEMVIKNNCCHGTNNFLNK